MLRIRAGVVFPVTAPPIEDGAVLVGTDGRITAVGPNARVPTPRDVEQLEFKDGVLTPGLVNVHTHLELTHLSGTNDEKDFAKWIGRVRALKDQSTPEQFQAAAEAGLRDCWTHGITCVADTGSTGATMQALVRFGGRGIVYQEVFGPSPAQVPASMTELEQQTLRLRRLATSQRRIGVSPHAPYTVCESLYRRVARFTQQERLPIALHLAESQEESELVRYGAGPFADALRARGIAVEPHHCSPVKYLRDLGLLRPGTLAIHCVQVDAEDVAALKASRAAVAHCPRSNRAHGHGVAPVALMRDAGVPVGIGTDSVVSVPDLDLWAEARTAWFGAEEALRFLTLEGAKALGWDREIGSLEAGKAGDIAVFAYTPPQKLPPPPVALATVLGGRLVHRS
ncbi:MAG TPA: amidohydrolase family protein [Gemmatimonadales bacterium]|nr:amidohydrolase family protein [Gemmatimonadales bacterium]